MTVRQMCFSWTNTHRRTSIPALMPTIHADSFIAFKFMYYPLSFFQYNYKSKVPIRCVNYRLVQIIYKL